MRTFHVTPKRRKQIVRAIKTTANLKQASRELGGLPMTIMKEISKEENIPLLRSHDRFSNPTIPNGKRRAILAELKKTPDMSPEEIAGTVGDVSILMVKNVFRAKNAKSFREAADLSTGVKRHMASRDFRKRLRALVQEFDDRLRAG